MKPKSMDHLVDGLANLIERHLIEKLAERPRYPTDVTLSDGTTQTYELPSLEDLKEDLKAAYEELQRALEVSRAINFARHGIPFDIKVVQHRTGRGKRR